jgi:hypothetical protein
MAYPLSELLNGGMNGGEGSRTWAWHLFEGLLSCMKRLQPDSLDWKSGDARVAGVFTVHDHG